MTESKDMLSFLEGLRALLCDHDAMLLSIDDGLSIVIGTESVIVGAGDCAYDYRDIEMVVRSLQ